jgi:hypothetical protein
MFIECRLAILTPHQQPTRGFNMSVNTLGFQRRACTLVASAIIAALSTAAYGGSGVQKPEWTPAVAVSEVNSTFPDGCPIESADGLSLFIASNRTGTAGANDIWAADRDSLTSPWGTPRNLGAPINMSAADFCPTPVLGRSLLFVSERLGDGTGPAPCGGGDIYLSRQSPAGGWSTPKMLKCAPEGPNFSGGERSPALVETDLGTYLFYSSNGSGGDQDIYVSRMGADGEFGPGTVVAELSTEFEDIMPNVRARADGMFEIVFSSNRPTWGRGEAASGGQDVYHARSWWPSGSWSAPRNLGGNVNTPGVEQRSTLSQDGKRLYFGRDGDIYMSIREGNY